MNKHRPRASTRLAARDGGQAIVMLALALPLSLALLLLVIDGGRLYVEQTRLRNAAQLAAEAGVSLAGEGGSAAGGRTITPTPREVRDIVAEALRRNLPDETYDFIVDAPFRTGAGAYTVRVRVTKPFVGSIERVRFTIRAEAAARLGGGTDTARSPLPSQSR